MDLKEVKNELQNIINGKNIQSQSITIQAAKAHISSHSQSGSQFKDAEQTRANEERALKKYAAQNNLLINRADLGNYITEGRGRTKSLL